MVAPEKLSNAPVGLQHGANTGAAVRAGWRVQRAAATATQNSWRVGKRWRAGRTRAWCTWPKPIWGIGGRFTPRLQRVGRRGWRCCVRGCCGTAGAACGSDPGRAAVAGSAAPGLQAVFVKAVTHPGPGKVTVVLLALQRRYLFWPVWRPDRTPGGRSDALQHLSRQSGAPGSGSRSRRAQRAGSGCKLIDPVVQAHARVFPRGGGSAPRSSTRPTARFGRHDGSVGVQDRPLGW